MLVKNKMQWHRETEVVVVGCGGAGLAAAITAGDSGAEVIALEKEPASKHWSSTAMSGGGFMSPTNATDAFTYKQALDKVAGGSAVWVDKQVNKAWAEYVSGNKGWVESLGARLIKLGSLGEHTTLPGASGIETYGCVGAAKTLIGLLKENAAKRGAQIVYGTWGDRLFTDHNGRVVGIRTKNEAGETTNIRAEKGVVLCTGGFEFNETMKLQYLPVYPVYYTGTAAATGDGVSMAQDVGAALWHMNCNSGRVVMKFPELPWAFAPELGGRGWIRKQHSDGGPAENPCGFIMVDKHAKRFTRENFKIHSFAYEMAFYDSQRCEFPRVPAYAIFDEKRIKACALCSVSSGPGGPARFYEWSHDNSKEIEKGWIARADTIKELAAQLGLDAGTLDKTVKNYNRYCQQGSDPEFNRHPGDLIPLTNAPYYAVKLWPGGTSTQGGPRRNARAQVVNVDGDPIRGLYSAGELGSTNAYLATGGGGVGEALASGRLAGESCARDRRR